METGFISPWFCVIFDDKFESVFGIGEDDVDIDVICRKLFEGNQHIYVELEYVNDELVHSPPPLDEIWLPEYERHEWKETSRSTG